MSSLYTYGQTPTQPSYLNSILSLRTQLRSPIPSSTPRAQSSGSPVLSRLQSTLLSSSTTMPQHAAAPFSTPNFVRAFPNKINHKALPFYRPIYLVYERHQAFQYDSSRKYHLCHDQFLLPFDACNQLALSSHYDLESNTHRTSKCLLLRLVRLDYPPLSNGTYDDNLPPNLMIQVNGQNVMNLPTPKLAARNQTDLFRSGREIDITPYCMFNPILKNDLIITWSYDVENTNLHLIYAQAQYAIHIFLAERLTINELCEQIQQKSKRFLRDDLIKSMAKAQDCDDGLEVSDQVLKITCPIDQRRLKKPARATTCQHFQCFDLTNYLGKKSFASVLSLSLIGIDSVTLF